jgi:hypothetical protein
MIRTRSTTASTAAALFALLMLSFASVQSIVMQAAMAAAGDVMPICGAVDPGDAMTVSMARLDIQRAVAGSAHDRSSGVPHQHPAACPYCAAAGHAPILAQTVPLRQATLCEFTAYRQVASLGPRGPPAQPPRARGPPLNPPTA